MRHLTFRAALLLARNPDWWEAPQGLTACDWSRIPHAELREGRHLNVTQTDSPESPGPSCPKCRAMYEAAMEGRHAFV